MWAFPDPYDRPMPMSTYLAGLREHVGHDLVMLPSVSAVLLNDNGEILLGQRSDNGRWALIAGAVDPGEQPADALIREVYEEVAVHVAIDHLCGVAQHPYRYPNGDRCEYLNMWFRCHPVGGEPRVNDEESLDVAWFPLDELPDLNDFTRFRIDVALRDEPTTWFAAPGERPEAVTGSGVA